MSEPTDDFFVVEQDSTPYTGDNLSSRSGSDAQVDSQLPLLPRSGWQNRQAFYKVLIKTKQSLDIAEVTALLDLE